MIDKTPSGILNEFKQDQDYKTNMGFTSAWPENVNYKEGKMWPPATEKTKHMPRPVINLCKFIVNNKKSNILSQSLKILFKPDEIPEDEDEAQRVIQAAEDYTDAAENVWEDLHQDDLNDRVVDNTLTIGTGIWYYYWDSSFKGGQFTPYVGKLEGETINAMDIAFGNPQLYATDTQKQPYITIRRRTDTDILRERAKKTGSDWEKIHSDTEDTEEKYDNGRQDLDKAYKTTSYVKLYKENGQVFWTEVTRDAVVQKPRPLAPDREKPIELYPVEVLVFEEREKCVFGMSVVEEAKGNNKTINTSLGLQLLGVQQTAWPKLLAKLGALQQAVTNEPGEIITDHFGQQGVDGIKFMQPPNFSQFPLILTDKLLELVRMTTSTTEVNNGEIGGANMAASAIIALQNQARKPNESFQNKFNRSMRNIGKIYEAFFKSYYSLPRPIRSQDKDGKEYTKLFTGTDYADVAFRNDIDVMPKTALDDSLQMTMLENLAAKGWIDKYQFAKYVPKSSISQELVRDFEKEKKMLEEQQQIQGKADEIVSGLTPEEQAYLLEHPELMDQMGGEQNAML